VHGYVTAFWWAVGIMLVAALLVAVLVRSDSRTPDPTGTDDEDEDVGMPALPVLTH
jgi:hypothetical protein